MDIYSIGLKVDSRQVKTAQKDLGGMGRQAKKTGNSVTNFGRDVDKSTRNVQGMSRGLDLAKRALAGFAAALSIRELQQFTQAALASAQNIERQSKALGVSAEEFQRLSFAFRQFGADSADISDALNTLADRAEDAKSGTQSFVDDFRLVGIEVDDLRGKNPDELFRLFAREVADIEDPTRRAAGVVRILGDDVGRRLIPLLQQGEQGLDRLGDQAQVASEEVIESSARIKSDLTELGTELETGLQNVFLESAARNEEQIRSLVATTLRGIGTIVQYADELAGPVGAGILGRVLVGKKTGAVLAAVTGTVQVVNTIIDRLNDTAGNELARVEQQIDDLVSKYEERGMEIPVGAQDRLDELRARQEELNSAVIQSIDLQEDYEAQLKKNRDVGEDAAQIAFDAADAFEATGSAVRTIDGPDSLPTVIAGMRDLSVAAQEVLGTTVQIPGSLANIADAGEDAGQTFAEKFEEQFEELGNSLGEALVDGDWESFGETIGDLIGAELSSVLSDQLSSVFGDIGSDLGGSLGTSIGQGLGTAVGGALGGAAGSLIGQEVGGFLEDALGGSEYDLEAVQARQNTGTVLGSIDQKSSSIDNSLEEIQGATDELVNINTGMLRSLQQVQNGIARASGRIAGQQPGAGINAPAPDVDAQALGGIRATSVGAFGAAALGAFGTAGMNAAGAILGAMNPLVSAVIAIDALFDGPISGILEGVAGVVDDLTFGLFSSIGGEIFGGGTSVVDRGVQIIGGEIGARMDETLIRAFARIKEDGGWFSSDDYYNRFAGVPGDVNRQFQLVLGEIVDSVRQGAEALGVLPQDIQQRLDDFVLKTRKISLKGLDADEQQEEIQAAFSAIFDRLAGAVVPFAKDFQNAGEGIGETIARLATQVGVFEELALSLGESIQSLTGRSRTAAATDLAQRLGGTENFAQAIATLEDNFFTEAEQFEANSRRLKSALDDLPLPDTREGFLDLIKAQDEATKSGRENIATLLRLQGSANEYYDYLEQDSGNAAEVARERADLERRVLEIQGKTDQIRQLELEKIDESNRALQQRVWRLEDEAAVERENDRLSRQLLEVQGDTSALRALELDSLDESNRSLQQRIWNLQDEKAISQERESLDRRLLELQGDTEALRQLEIDALNKSNKPLLERIFRLEDEKEVQQETDRLERQLLEVQGETGKIRQLELDSLDKSNRELQKRIWRLEDEAAVEQEEASLNRQLLELQGDTSALRALELDSLDESNHSLQKRIWNLQEENQVQQEQERLENELLQVQGKTSEIRQQELDQLDPTNRELQKRIWRLQDEQEVLRERSALETELLQAYDRTGALIKQQLAGMTSENAALQIAISLKENVANAQQQVNQAEQDLVGAYEREISSLEKNKSVYKDNIETAKDLAETWKGLTETLRESADELLGVGVGEPTASRSSFQQTLTAALGGDREAFEALPQLATDLSEAERSQAGTLAEARRANARIASELDKAADQAEDQYLEQLSEKQIAQRSLDRLDTQISQYNRQIEKLTEQELTIQQAKAAVTKAEATLKTAQDANTQAINKLQELLPDSIVNGLLEPLSPLEQIDASTKAMVGLLGNLDAGGTVGGGGAGPVDHGDPPPVREPDSDILDAAKVVYESATGGVATSKFNAAEEAVGGDIYSAVGWQGDPQELKDRFGFKDGGIASGPTSGYNATLHGTEAVIPLNGQRIPLEVNNQEMIQELRDLRNEVSQLRTEQSQSQYQITKNTKRTKETLEQFDIEGLPPERSTT